MDQQPRKIKKVLSLKDKVGILKQLEDKLVRQKDVANKYGIDKSVISRIKSNRDALLYEYKLNPKSKKKAFTVGRFQVIEDALLRYIKVLRDHSLPISSEFLREKAVDIAKKLDVLNFNASSGWFTKFKKRNNLRLYKLSGKEDLVDEAIVIAWVDTELKRIESKYPQKCIYNVDETGLLYELLPSSTLTTKGEKNKFCKDSKNRITLLLGCNMEGKKLTPLVVGKSKKPRCFSGVKNLPVLYEANSSAWMTSRIFSNWLSRINDIQMERKEKIAILMDNAPCHNIDDSLKLDYVEVVYLPKNTTSKLQPLDQGIIRSFKSHYKKKYLRRVIENFETSRTNKIDLLETLYFVLESWNCVTVDTIGNCFQHAFNNGSEARIIDFDEKFELDEVEEGRRIFNTMDDFNGLTDVNEDFLFEQPELDCIIEEIKTERGFNNGTEQEDALVNEERMIRPSRNEVKKSFEVLKAYLMTTGDDKEEKFQELVEFEAFFKTMYNKGSKQTTLDRFLE